VDYMIREKDSKQYVEYISENKHIKNEQDALEIVGICYENKTNRLMLHEANISSEFFDLSSGVAGNILQKFINYSIIAVAVLEPETVNQGKFREMVIEVNRGKHFRVFHDCAEASEWLVSQD
jgi:PadR family transcriptional regulator, regulatory protein AphA